MIDVIKRHKVAVAISLSVNNDPYLLWIELGWKNGRFGPYSVSTTPRFVFEGHNFFDFFDDFLESLHGACVKDN